MAPPSNPKATAETAATPEPTDEEDNDTRVPTPYGRSLRIGVIKEEVSKLGLNWNLSQYPDFAEVQGHNSKICADPNRKDEPEIAQMHAHTKAIEALFGIIAELHKMDIESRAAPRASTVVLKKSDFSFLIRGLKDIYLQLLHPCQSVDEIEPQATKPNTPEPPCNAENSMILNALTQIQDSMANLESKYLDIEAKVMNSPKAYADIVKASMPPTPVNPPTSQTTKPEHSERRRESDIIRKERERHGVMLSTKGISPETRQLISTTSAKTITERCQNAVNRACNHKANIPQIIGIRKLASTIRLQFETEDQANIIRALSKTKDTIWNAAFKGLKLHEPTFGIVVHGVSIANLDPKLMSDPAIIKDLEKQNTIVPGTITSITPLLRRNQNDSASIDPDKFKRHYSIVICTNNQHAANKCITHGFYIDHAHHTTERFAPQYQRTQCYKCYEHGHQATSCKRSQPRCGKCGEDHSTQDCTNSITHCFHCHGSHEAWHSQCPANITEKKRLEGQKGHSPRLFN
jgi:cellular nucleic acid-binding protein